MCLCNQLCKMQYLWPELSGNPPLVALPLLLFQLMRLPCGRHPLPVRMYGLMYGGGGGAKYASKVKLWASWFCMDGGDEQAFLRSLDISANLNQEVRDVEEDVVLFQNQFLTCTVILTGDGKGMQAMGGAGSKCWLCKDPNGIVEQRGVESTSRWGAFLRSVTPDRRPGDYQHAATKFSKAWGDSGWSPTRWIHWCLAHSTFFAEKWRNIFQFSSIPTEYRHGPYKRRLKNCFKGWSLVRPSVSLRHMHHCMSMNALEQGLFGLEAAKASDIDAFV